MLKRSRQLSCMAIAAMALMAWAPAQAQSYFNGYSDAFATRVLAPGETTTVTITLIPPGENWGLAATLTEPTLNPGSGPFAITGGTCDTTTYTEGNDPTSNCTIEVTNTSNVPVAAEGTLSIGCVVVVAQVGGFMFNCSATQGGGAEPTSSPGVVARFSSRVAAAATVAVDTLGPTGLTLLALSLFGFASAVGLRKKT